jgi:hypothetical protein
MKYTLAIVLLICLCGSASLYAQPKQDISDSVFSIVMPEPRSRDIDMGDVLVNSSQDSLFDDFMWNPGTWQYRVDSIYFTGADAAAFALISGKPVYTVLPGGLALGEFSFSPVRTGPHSAFINIITQTDTLRQNIIGNGIQPDLRILNNFIDFGRIRLGSFKDSLQCLMLYNAGTAPVRVFNTIQGGPNAVDFSILAGGGAFILNPGDTIRMDLRFQPSFEGRTSGSIVFEHDAAASPAIVRLLGEGYIPDPASARLTAGSAKAFPGEIVEIPISITEQLNMDESGITALQYAVRFNPTLLEPIAKQGIMVVQDTIIGPERVYTIQMPYPGKDTLLGTLRFRAALGNDSITPILLSSVKAIGGRATVRTQPGQFNLLGICYAGGPRLIAVNGIISLSIQPNPVTDMAKILFSIIESGTTRIWISDQTGRERAEVFNGILPTGQHQLMLNSMNLNIGSYLLHINTPTYAESLPFRIIR